MKALYKIITTNRPEWSLRKIFNSQADADAYASSLGSNYTATYYADYTPLDLETKLDLDLNFGKSLIREFVKDNRITQISSAEEDAMMVKFNVMLNYANVGAIRKISEMLPNESVTSIFTQERKDKYLQMITDYLNSL
jgi:hypothetical protein